MFYCVGELFVECIVICLGVIVVLLLNVVVLFYVAFYCLAYVWFSMPYVCFVCNLTVSLGLLPNACFVLYEGSYFQKF